MIRFCVSCRNRDLAQNLIPFRLGEDNTLLLGAGKRSAWVCSKRKCLIKLSQNPKQAQRSLKTRTIKANSCLEQVQKNNKEAICKYLSLSQQSGVVFSGRSPIQKNQNKLLFIILSTAFPKKPKYIIELLETLPSPIQIFHLNTLPSILGRWIGRGPRKALGLTQNRHSLQLLKYLHQHRKLR